MFCGKSLLRIPPVVTIDRSERGGGTLRPADSPGVTQHGLIDNRSRTVRRCPGGGVTSDRQRRLSRKLVVHNAIEAKLKETQVTGRRMISRREGEDSDTR